MEYLLKASAIIFIFYFFYKVFLQRETFFQSNRWYLLAGILLAIVTPLIVIPVQVTKVIGPIQNMAFNAPVSTIEASDSFSTIEMTYIIYLLVALFLSIRFLIQICSLIFLLLNNKTEVHDGFTYVKTSDDVAPFSFFKWIVYNPNQFEAMELQQIIAHEKIHVFQWHSIDILLGQISSIVLWFNPFVWLYKKELQQNLEYIADAKALNYSYCKKSYQHLLLKTSMPHHHMALTNNFYNSLIKKRIVMLHKSKSKKHSQLKFILILPLLALFLMSFNTKAVVTYKALNPSAELETLNFIPINSIEIFVINKDMSDDDLDKLVKEASKKGIQLKFKGVKRNSSKEIVSIEISAKTKDSKASYHTQHDAAIKTISIKVDVENNAISIGNGHAKNTGKDYHFVTKDGVHKVKKLKKGSNVYAYSSNHDDDADHDDNDNNHVYIVKSGDKSHATHRAYTSDDGDKIFVTTGKGKSTWTTGEGQTVKVEYIDKGGQGNVVFISDDDKEPLHILNGKEISKKEMEDIDPETIEKVEVIKGDNATKKYGDKAKDGAIIITTK